MALASNGLIDSGERATCYPTPGFRKQLEGVGLSVSEDRVVVSDNVITSQGPGTSLDFALRLGQELYGKEKRDEIAQQMLVH